MHRPLSILLAFCGLLAVTDATASSDAAVKALLAQEKAPAGVVFEIVTGDSNGLRWAIPAVTRYADQLRARFPGLTIAVVTHGDEQFALLDEREHAYRQVHKEVRNLTEKKDVSVQVCGTYAGMKNFTPEEFATYIDVAASGPATINDYRAIGYTHVLVTRPEILP